MNRPSLILGAAIASMLAVQPASAASATIATSDIDVSTDAGLKEFERRLDQKVEEVCYAGQVRTGTILRSKASKQCEREIRAAASRQLSGLATNTKAGG